MACQPECQPTCSPSQPRNHGLHALLPPVDADVYHLRKGGYISNKLWYAWEREIKHTLAGRIFRREWEWLEIEFSHNEDFLGYINELMKPNQLPSAAPEPYGPLTGGS